MKYGALLLALALGVNPLKGNKLTVFNNTPYDLQVTLYRVKQAQTIGQLIQAGAKEYRSQADKIGNPQRIRASDHLIIEIPKNKIWHDNDLFVAKERHMQWPAQIKDNIDEWARKKGIMTITVNTLKNKEMSITYQNGQLSVVERTK